MPAPARPLVTLRTLTGGMIPYGDFEDFIKAEGQNAQAMAEAWINHEMEDAQGCLYGSCDLGGNKIVGFPVKIPGGDFQPMHDRHGAPLLDADRQPLCVSWEWAAFLAETIRKKAGCGCEYAMQNLWHLPLPVFKPVDIVAITADGHVLMSMRSKDMQNSPDTAFATAAGSPVRKDGGTAGFTRRVLREQIGFDYSDQTVAVCSTDFPLIRDRTFVRYTVGLTSASGRAWKVKGGCPGLGETVAVKTKQDLQQIVRSLSLADKYAAILAPHLNDLAALHDDPQASFKAPFWEKDGDKLSPAAAHEFDLSLLSYHTYLTNPATIERSKLDHVVRILDAAQKVGFPISPPAPGAGPGVGVNARRAP